MHTFLLCVATAVVGIEVGWERLPEGGMRYIIQIEPQTMDAMRAGEQIGSDIPPRAGEIRSFCLIMGKKSLPHDEPAPPARAKIAEQKKAEPKTADRPPPLPAPRALEPDPSGRSLPEQQAAYQAPPPSTAAAQPPSKPAADVSPEKPAVPWLPLTCTLFGLFASLAANAFLGWVTFDARQRLRKIHQSILSPQP